MGKASNQRKKKFFFCLPPTHEYMRNNPHMQCVVPTKRCESIDDNSNEMTTTNDKIFTAPFKPCDWWTECWMCLAGALLVNCCQYANQINEMMHKRAPESTIRKLLNWMQLTRYFMSDVHSFVSLPFLAMQLFGRGEFIFLARAFFFVDASFDCWVNCVGCKVSSFNLQMWCALAAPQRIKESECVIFTSTHTHTHGSISLTAIDWIAFTRSDEYLYAWINVECNLHTIIYTVVEKSFDTQHQSKWHCCLLKTSSVCFFFACIRCESAITNMLIKLVVQFYKHFDKKKLHVENVSHS